MHLFAMSKVNLPKHFFAVVLLASVAPYQVAHAQQPLHLPSSDLSIPGVAQNSPISVPPVNISAYADLSRAEALAIQFKDAIPHTRSPQDIALFRQVSPSVVLILTKDAAGSGSLLQANVILTSLHVVDHNRAVQVVFKPADPSGKANTDEVVTGEVVKVDAQLLKPQCVTFSGTSVTSAMSCPLPASFNSVSVLSACSFTRFVPDRNSGRESPRRREVLLGMVSL